MTAAVESGDSTQSKQGKASKPLTPSFSANKVVGSVLLQDQSNPCNLLNTREGIEF